MATAEDGGSPSKNVASSYGGGGAGGKFRKKPFRKQPTPYDRPSTAYRGTNSSGNTGGSWMTKMFFDPASKLISYGANRFFASVFRKRLPPPPPPQPPEVNNDVSEMVEGAVLNIEESAQEPAGGESSVPTNSRISGISELEQLLKQKTFSRSEIAHLTKLLQSRAVVVPIGGDSPKNEVGALDIERQEQFASPLQENKNEAIRSSAEMSTHVLNSKVLEDEIATPAELAKAYMGSRPSKGSSSVIATRHVVGMEGTGLPSNRPFSSKMPLTSLIKKDSVSLAASDNGFVTPRSRGRSAIYSMARAPYSRVHQTSIFKGSRSNNSGNAGPSMSSSTFSPVVTEEKYEALPMTLKRRSSVLDEEIASIGSIRRTRQKSNLLAPRNPEISHGVVIGSHAKQKLQSTGEPSHKVLQAVGETESESVPIRSHARVPSKSSEVAARIFQHLEKLTPKEKSPESRLVVAREKSPMKLTSGMLSGQALRSMEDVNSSKLLLGDPHDHELGDSSVPTLPNSSQKPRNIEENGPKESAAPSGMWNSGTKNDSAGSLKASAATKTTDFVVENGAPQPPGKKRTFRMSAQEDSFDQDDEVHSNGLIATLSSEKMGTTEAPLRDSEPAPAEVVPKLVKTTNPASEEATLASHLVVPPFSVVASEKPVESTSFPVFSSKVADRLLALSSESNKNTESGLESSSSLFNASASTRSQLKLPGLDKSGHPSSSEAGDINNKSDEVPYAKRTHASSSSPVFATAAADHLNQASTGSGLMFTSTTSFSNIVSTGISANTSATSSGSTFGLSAKPSNSAGPFFKFGASVDPTTSGPATSASKISELADEKTKVDTNPSSGSSSIPNSSVAASPAANPENSSFGLSSSVSHSTVNLQGSLFGSASKSIVSGTGTVSQDASLLSVPSTSSPGTVSQGTSVLPASSGPSTLFGMNGNTSGSSFSNPQVLNSSNAFSYSLSASSSDTTTVAPGSGSTSSVFKFGASPVSEANAVSSSSASTPGIFSFGFGSSTSSSTTATGSNSSATLPKFNFGSNSSVPVGSSSTGSLGIFNFGGNSSTSSAVNTVGSNTAANVFGSSWSSPASSIFGSSSTTAPTSSIFGSSSTTPASSIFGSSSTTPASSIFGSSSTMSPASSIFGSRSTTSPASSIFGSSSTTSPSTAFSFGGASTSSAATNTAPVSFNSSTVASSSPMFSFTTASASVLSSPSLPTNQPVFGNPPTNAFGSSSGNNEQMNGEDSMAEDPVQSSTASTPLFGQSSVTPSPPGFTFGSTVPSQPNPFMFGSQQNQVAPQNPSPFQASGSLEFNAGGSFSLGSGGGGDKSGRRMVRVSRSNKNRKR